MSGRAAMREIASRDPRHAVAEILAAVRGDEDQPLAGEALSDFVEPGGERRIGGDPGGGGVERVDHCVAGDMDRRRIHILAAQCLGSGFGGSEMLVGYRRDDPAIHFLGPGLIDVARTQSGLDVTDRDLPIICGERTDHRGGGIALDKHAIGLLGIEHPAEAGEQACSEVVERLARRHHVEIHIGHDSGDREHLIEQAAMLRGDAGADTEPALRLKRLDDGEELDRFRARAEYDENLGYGHGVLLARDA